MDELCAYVSTVAKTGSRAHSRETATEPAWQLTTLFDRRAAIVRHDAGRWSVVLRGHSAVGDTLDRVLCAVAAECVAERRRARAARL
jgi:hypothetical protein